MLIGSAINKKIWIFIFIFIVIGVLSATLIINKRNRTVAISMVNVKMPEEMEVVSKKPLTLASRSGNLRIHVHTLTSNVKTAEAAYIRYLESKGINYQTKTYNVGGKIIEGIERAETQNGKQYKMIKISINPDLIIDVDFLSDASGKAREDFALKFLKLYIIYRDH